VDKKETAAEIERIAIRLSNLRHLDRGVLLNDERAHLFELEQQLYQLAVKVDAR
jgi:hypothetical protein